MCGIKSRFSFICNSNIALPNVISNQCLPSQINYFYYKLKYIFLTNKGIKGAFLLLVLLSVLCSSHIKAATYIVSESEFEQLQLEAQLTMKNVHNTFEFLQLLPVNEHQSKKQQIILQHIALSRIPAHKELTKSEIALLKTLTLDESELEVVNSDHPHKTIPAIKISKQAKSLISINELHLKEQDIAKKWGSNQFLWSDYFNPELYPSLILFVNNHLNISALSNDFSIAIKNEDISDLLPDNQLLLVFIEKLNEQKNYGFTMSFLFETMLSRPVDQFSYQAIQLLTQLTDSQLALSILELAIYDPKLCSQALLIVASTYSQTKSGKQLLVDSLQNEETRWQGLMAISQISDKKLQRELFDSIPIQYRDFKNSAESVLLLNYSKE